MYLSVRQGAKPATRQEVLTEGEAQYSAILCPYFFKKRAVCWMLGQLSEGSK